MKDSLVIRVTGDKSQPTVIYLPGSHGDWTLAASFRAALGNRVRLVEFTYPRTVTWTLEEHASAVLESLELNGIREGWLLGESFGSQIVWPLLSRAEKFRATGVILAGGFGRYPYPRMARLALNMTRWTPKFVLRMFLRVYSKFAIFRHRKAPETLASIAEFVERRSAAFDFEAIRHRLRLICQNDPRTMAQSVQLPVYFLAGFFDPVVPWLPARHWIKVHCPGYCGSRIVFRADHNVLGTAPGAAAKQVLEWIHDGKGPCGGLGKN